MKKKKQMKMACKAKKKLLESKLKLVESVLSTYDAFLELPKATCKEYTDVYENMVEEGNILDAFISHFDEFDL